LAKPRTEEPPADLAAVTGGAGFSGGVLLAATGGFATGAGLSTAARGVGNAAPHIPQKRCCGKFS